jgi:hypothetical protein
MVNDIYREYFLDACNYITISSIELLSLNISNNYLPLIARSHQLRDRLFAELFAINIDPEGSLGANNSAVSSTLTKHKN